MLIWIGNGFLSVKDLPNVGSRVPVDYFGRTLRVDGLTVSTREFQFDAKYNAINIE
jgi:hypothetical protein